MEVFGGLTADFLSEVDGLIEEGEIVGKKLDDLGSNSADESVITLSRFVKGRVQPQRTVLHVHRYLEILEGSEVEAFDEYFTEKEAAFASGDDERFMIAGEQLKIEGKLLSAEV